MIWPRKVKLDRRNAEALRLYSTDDLRELYQGKPRTDEGDLIPLRDGIVSRAEIKAEILWRLWWDRFGYRVLLAVSVIGAVAAVIAAVEGLHGGR